jgi:hypothetical protein
MHIKRNMRSRWRSMFIIFITTITCRDRWRVKMRGAVVRVNLGVMEAGAIVGAIAGGTG